MLKSLILVLIILVSTFLIYAKDDSELYPSLSSKISNLPKNTNKIPNERKQAIKEFAKFIAKKIQNGNDINLIFICTHNSRRSHIAQLWTFAISNYFGISGINCYSDGTEATAFNYRLVGALKKCGFEIEQIAESSNTKIHAKLEMIYPNLFHFPKNTMIPPILKRILSQLWSVRVPTIIVHISQQQKINFR